MISLLAVTLVVCAPGYPGNTAEAQPAMDALARSIAAAAHLPEGSVNAVYEETAQGGVKRLGAKDAAILLAPLPFYLEEEKGLRLTARLMAAPDGAQPLERWTLMAGKQHAPSLAGTTVQTTAGYSKRFVHAMAPSLPEDAQIVASQSVLSALRRAANGEKVAALLDGAQGAAVEKLPFAAALARVESSDPVPVAVVATVGRKLPEKQWKALRAALLSLSGEAAAREALQGVRMSGFVPLDEKALSSARAAFARAK